MKTNQDYKNAALAALRGNWGKAVVATLIYVLLISLITGPTIYTTTQMQSQLTELAATHPTGYQAAALIHRRNSLPFRRSPRAPAASPPSWSSL